MVGGGLAGCWAAYQSSKDGAKVILVEKGYVGTSGCTAFSAGDILWWTPEDDLDQWVRNYSRWGDHLLDPDWLEMTCREVHPLIQEMDAMGIPFIKDERGRLARKPGRGHNAAVVVPGYQLMMAMRRQVKKAGVKIIDNVSVVRLIQIDDQMAGAAGVHPKTGDLYLFETKEVVVATGGCSWKGNFFGQDMVSGEGYALAYRAGAELSNMEYCNSYNSSHRDFDVYGLSRFQRLGGKFTNALGERFMPKYNPEFGDGAPLHQLTQAMALEVRDGRGPIYFDLKEMKEEDRTLTRHLLPMLMKLMERSGINLFEDRMEWVPGFIGAVACGGGIKLVDFTCRATVEGLYATGDAACGTVIIGAAPGHGGINLSWAAVTGKLAGRAAAEASREKTSLEISDRLAGEIEADILKPCHRSPDLDPGEAFVQLQELAIPAEYNLLRHGDRMRLALSKLEVFEREVLPNLPAANGHQLVQCFEVEATALVTRIMFESALLRTETRGFHYRDDYPQRDNQNWLKWINARDDHGRTRFTTEPVPVEKFSRYGIAIPE